MALDINEKLQYLLSSFNLSRTEQSLYIAGLKFTDINVTELVRQTNINRTTAYHALTTLKQKGFASESMIHGKLVYTMTRPGELGHNLNRKIADIKKQKQDIEGLMSLFPVVSPYNQVLVEKFDGIESVKNAVEKALYAKVPEWRIIAPKDNFFANVGSDYAKYFMQTRRNRHIKAKTLWEMSSRTKSSLSLETLLQRKPRYLPAEFDGTFKSVIIIFDDKALFLTSAEKQTAVLLQSQEIVDTLTVLFDGLWKISEKPPKH